MDSGNTVEIIGWLTQVAQAPDIGIAGELVRWLTKIAGAGIAILPLFIIFGLIKTVSQLDNIVGKFTGSVGKGASGMGEKMGQNINNRRQKNAADGTGIYGKTPLGAKRRRDLRKDNLMATLADEAKRSGHHYVSRYTSDDKNEKYRQQLAGGLPALAKLTGGKLGLADPAAIQRALAGAKFKIEQAELEEVKAAHASIDHLDEVGLNRVLGAGSGASNATKAAALERLVSVGGMKSIQEAVNTVGKSGKSDIMTKTLANALQKDGPQFLKAPDIDNIRNGKLGSSFIDTEGKTQQIKSTLQEITLDNLASGVMSAEKIVKSSGNELSYAQDLADTAAAAGNTQAQTVLQQKANEVLNSDILKVQIKHNGSAVYKMAGKPMP
jgi:hypothetical protein